MKHLIASIAVTAPALFAAWVGTAANWAALVAQPFVARNAPQGIEAITETVAILETRQVVPAEGDPDTIEGRRLTGASHSAARADQTDALSVSSRRANNSLDAIRYRDRTYLAFRSAGRHEPDESAEIVVVSSSDENHWQAETTLSLGTEIRHPKFLRLHDKLFLYASTLSNHKYIVDPRAVVATSKKNGVWSSVSELELPGQVVTQVGKDAGMPLMVVTLGAHSPFEFGASPPTVRVLTTADGYVWQTLTGQDDSGMAAGATSASFSREEDGNSLGVINRSVNGSETGTTFVCLSTDSTPNDWDCNSTPLNLWNPSTFRVGMYSYVLGGLAVDVDGPRPEQAKRDLPAAFARVRNEVARLASRQRCGIWRIDARSRDLIAVGVLPSKGHECNAKALVDSDTGRVTVYSVSSPTRDGDPALVAARRGETHIYRHKLQLPGKGESGAPSAPAEVMAEVVEVSRTLAD